MWGVLHLQRFSSPPAFIILCFSSNIWLVEGWTRTGNLDLSEMNRSLKQTTQRVQTSAQAQHSAQIKNFGSSLLSQVLPWPLPHPPTELCWNPSTSFFFLHNPDKFQFRATVFICNNWLKHGHTGVQTESNVLDSFISLKCDPFIILIFLYLNLLVVLPLCISQICFSPSHLFRSAEQFPGST